MKIPNSRHRGERDNDQAMTSMIDVVFLLLIFFVCASIGQVGELLVRLDLSSGSTTTDAIRQKQPEQITLEIALKTDTDGNPQVSLLNSPDKFLKQRNGRFYRAADKRTLVDALKQLAEDPDMPVVLDIADDITSQDILTVHTAVHNAGFKSINFAVKASEANPAKR